MNAQPADTIEISREEHEALRRENACLKEELSQLKRLIFGKKNERFIPSDSAQTSLAFEGDDDPGIASSNDLQQISYSRAKPNKKKPVRLELPAHLPREEEVLEPEEKGEDAIKIGETVTEILEYTPGKVYVKRYVRPKYVQSANQGSEKNEKQVVVAPLPTLPIPSGNAGPGLLAHLMISKPA